MGTVVARTSGQPLPATVIGPITTTAAGKIVSAPAVHGTHGGITNSGLIAMGLGGGAGPSTAMLESALAHGRPMNTSVGGIIARGFGGIAQGAGNVVSGAGNVAGQTLGNVISGFASGLGLTTTTFIVLVGVGAYLLLRK